MDRMKMHGAPSWFEYSGGDGAAARRFYADVLGWNISDMPMADGSNYGFINIGEEGVGGFSMQPSPAASWTVYVTVDDVDARFKKAIEAGGKALAEPFDAPGVGRMAHFADPAGAHMAFIKYV